MVQTFKTRSHFDIPYPILCPVYFLRYPNNLATHVLSVDVLSREIISRPIEGQPGEGDEQQVQHILKTSRLILKRGTLPKWAPKGIIRNAESWVLEESEVELDPIRSTQVLNDRKGKGREMKSWTRNLDHTTVMAVTELNIFREKLEKQDTRDEIAGVGLKAKFDVTSGVSFGLLRNRIEKFGLNRVLTHIDNSRQGILATHARFLEQRFGFSLDQANLDPQAILPESRLVSKRARLLAALRPPFLDGDFVGPIARMKVRLIGVRDWWRGLDRGGVGDEGSFRLRSKIGRESEDEKEGNLTPAERLRKRFLNLRDQGRSAFRREEEEDDDDDY